MLIFPLKIKLLTPVPRSRRRTRRNSPQNCSKPAASPSPSDRLPIRPPKVTWCRTKSPSKAEILRQGAEAMRRLSGNSSRDWADWLKVLAALGIGRHVAMLESGSNEPHGYKYCTAFSNWLRRHEAFQTIDQADRKRMFDCLDNLAAIEEWRARLAPSQQLKSNHPIIVLREWKRSQRPASPPSLSPPPSDPPPPALRLLAPTELRRQLEILGLDRFRREVLPPGWRDPLRDIALALATPNAADRTRLSTSVPRQSRPRRAEGR